MKQPRALQPLHHQDAGDPGASSSGSRCLGGATRQHTFQRGVVTLHPPTHTPTEKIWATLVTRLMSLLGIASLQCALRKLSIGSKKRSNRS